MERRQKQVLVVSGVDKKGDHERLSPNAFPLLPKPSRDPVWSIILLRATNTMKAPPQEAAQTPQIYSGMR